MRIFQKILLLLLIITLLASSMLYDAYYAAPKRITPRYVTLSSESIPEQMDSVSILFFSDLDYNRFFREDRLRKLARKISDLSPDIIIFGGDMFDAASDRISDATVDELKSALSSLKAPLGKFAVLGDTDNSSLRRKQIVVDILDASDFELLENTSVPLRNRGSQSVTLIGLDSGLKGEQDINKAYANVSRGSYALTVCHTPDSADLVPSDLTDYFLAGHSHGGQVFYGFGSLYAPDMAVNYLRGRHTIDSSFTLDISSGVGTTQEDVRFLANSEVVLYTLRHIRTAAEEPAQ